MTWHFKAVFAAAAVATSCCANTVLSTPFCWWPKILNLLLVCVSPHAAIPQTTLPTPRTKRSDTAYLRLLPSLLLAEPDRPAKHNAAQGVSAQSITSIYCALAGNCELIAKVKRSHGTDDAAIVTFAVKGCLPPHGV